MNAKVTFGETQKPEPLLVPAEAFFTEGGQKYVWRLGSGGKPEKRTVKTGESDGKQMEVLEGLAEGDKILLKQPK